MKDGSFENLKFHLGEEIDRLTVVRGDDNWSSVRNKDKFRLVTRDYPFGQRNSYERIDPTDTLYADLQASRGLSVFENSDYIPDPEKIWKVEGEMTPIDEDRAEEIEHLRVNHGIMPGVTTHSRVEGQHTGFAELGFRFPKLLRHYQETYGIPVRGYDVVPLNIQVGQALGYDVRRHDFNARHAEPLDLIGCSLVASYHMLEHLSNPWLAVMRIHAAMDPGAYLHVEIPLEHDKPQLSSGHMFGFNIGDLGYMLRHAGFLPINLTLMSSFDPEKVKSLCGVTDFHNIERYMVRKPPAS